MNLQARIDPLLSDAARRGDIPGVAAMKPQGAFYAFPSFEGVLGLDIGGVRPANTLELCEVILDQAKVALVPGEAFDAPGYARISFAVSDADIIEGIGRIATLLGSAK